MASTGTELESRKLGVIGAKERALFIAKLAVMINYGNVEHSVRQAEAFLVAAENLVAKKYGEFR